MIKIGTIENGQIEREFYREGHIFKDEEAFLNKSGTCYVDEQSDDEYTYDDFLKAANNNLELARRLFYTVCWESPYTLYDQWLSSDEIKECEACKRTFLAEGDEDMECPYCNEQNDKEDKKCICDQTDCILSTELTYKGNTIFADLRLDLDDEDRQEMDIHLGFIDPETSEIHNSEWSESLPIRFCPMCGKDLKYRNCY